MAREAHAEAARRNQEGGGRKAELFPFAFWTKESSALFPGKRNQGFGLASKRDINRNKDRSIYLPDIYLKKNRFRCAPFIKRSLAPSHETALLQWMAEGP